jgi:hypothetical protein
MRGGGMWAPLENLAAGGTHPNIYYGIVGLKKAKPGGNWDVLVNYSPDGTQANSMSWNASGSIIK